MQLASLGRAAHGMLTFAEFDRPGFLINAYRQTETSASSSVIVIVILAYLGIREACGVA